MTLLQTTLSGLVKFCVAFSLLLSTIGSARRVQAAPIDFETQSSSFRAEALPEPHIVQVTPEPGFLDERSSSITIKFDVPMERASTEAAFSMQPEVPHQFEWDDSKTLVIQFSEPLAPGKQYVLTVMGGNAENAARSLHGVALSEDYRWYYWLNPFDVSVTTPHATQVALKFNTPIDTKKSGLPFEIEPELDGEWKWGSDKLVFFTASSAFPPAQRYTINLNGPLYDRFGAIPYEGPGLAFTAPPPVRSVKPEEGLSVQASFGPIEIIFSEPVDILSAQNAFSISPPISGHFSWGQSKEAAFQDTLLFMPDTLLEKGKEYTVSLSPSLKSRAGTPLMLDAYHRTFTVDPYYNSYSAPASFGEGGYNVQVVDVNGPRKVQFGAGEGLVAFELYRYDLIDFVTLYAEDAGGGYGLPAITLPAAEEERLVATWYYTEGASNSLDETVIPPDVPPGLYLLNMKHEGRSYSQLFVVLTRNSVVAKLSGDQLFVWVSDINGGNIADAEIRLYSERGEKIREGKTDEQGIYRVTVPAGYDPLLVSAKVVQDRETDISITGLGSYWNSYGWWDWNSRDTDMSKYLIYTYTDRPIYRPGQTINFKSILRHDQDVKYSMLPAGTPVTVNVRDPKNNLIHSTQAPLSEFGTINGSFAVAEGSALGEYSIEVLADGEGSRQLFKVQDYRKPDFKVNLTPSDPDQGNLIISGQDFDLDVDVRYFFDEPVAGAKLSYAFYELFPYYDWWNPDPDDVTYDWAETSSQSQGNVRTAADDGTARFTVRTTQNPDLFEYSYFDDWRSSLRTKTYAVEVTADDGSNQPVSATYIYKVTNAAEKYSLETQGYFKTPDSPFTVQASVRNLQDQPVARREMLLQIKKWNSKSYDYQYIGKNYHLTSDAGGTAEQEMTLEPGYYQLVLTGEDSLGNSVSYEHWMGVFSNRDDWYERNNSELAIHAEKELYKPYETARFMIESPFSGPALLTFERGSVIHSKQVDLTAPLTVVEAQIIPEDAPNIFVSINAWEPAHRPETEEGGYYFTNIPDSQFRIARTELLVEAEAKSLDVAISTDKATYAPGDEITVDINVRDNAGRPAEAEVSLALVDEAIFSLSHELSKNIFAAFYGPRPLSVETYDSMRPYREIMAGGRGGGGGDGFLAEPRRDFPDTAAWYPVLVTDRNGRASITFTLPDNLTSWRLSAKAITLNHQVGETHTNIETKKDLLLRPFLPRVLTTGDQAELTVMVHNYSNRERTVKVTLDGRALQIQNEPAQSVAIPAGGAMPLGWKIVPTGTTETKVTFTAVASDDRSSDSIELLLPVQPLAVADVRSVSGSFAESISLDLPLPANVLADNSLVTLRLSRSPASSLLDGLEYLTGYPYGCVEQTMSRAMPNAVLGRASSQLGIGGEEFRVRVDPLIAASIQKLYGFQHQDGGWGWWFDDASDDYQTAWVLHGLAVIQSSGYSVEPRVIENAAQYLNENLADMDIRTRAYALYSLTLAGKGNLEAAGALADSSVQQLDPFSQAALALALKELGDDPRSGAITDLLESSAVLKGGFAYWPQTRGDGEYHSKTMASSIRTTAFVLSAILAVEGAENPLAKPAADYLISKRTGYGWGSTNETSFTILALTDYLRSQQVEEGTTEFTVLLNGAELSSGRLEPGRLFSNIAIPFSALNSGANTLALNTSGTGPLYYDLITRYTSSERAVEPAGNIAITRKYLDPKTKKPLEEVSAGQLVKVELTVRMPQSGSFMLIEDHLPGGLEALNEGLNTTSHVSLDYDEYYDGTQYRWEDYGYNNKEIHGDRVTFFITEMSSGTRILSYLTRATTAGTFVALPAESYAMYDPLLWGRSSSTVFIVEPR